jgi:2-beta-glucuronyltransferase
MTVDRARMAKVLIFSEHDYRTARRANLQPIADALVTLGHNVTFISIRYSSLSVIKGDSRNGIRANIPEIYNGIECYLWRNLVHPFNPGRACSALTAPLYWVYPRLRNDFIDKAIRSAAIMIVESGFGAVLLARARLLNREAKLVYYASDDLQMIGAHPIVQHILEQSGKFVDYVCISSRRMAARFRWMAERVHFVPHGINPADFADALDSPYSEKLNGVSVGSGLFDPEFFIHASPSFPNIQFHVIGSGADLPARKNLRVYKEMPFRDTIRYIKNATFGIAPYKRRPGSDYVCDTSMKLMQYEYLGLPAVCSDFAVGDSAYRFGYLPGNAQSIATSIKAALAAKDRIRPRREFLTWEGVARRILNPELFPDTQLQATSYIHDASGRQSPAVLSVSNN